MTEAPLARAVARVEATTIAIGVVAAIYEWTTAGWRSALAIAVGSTISWLNYRWLRSGVTDLAPVPVAPGAAASEAETAANPPDSARPPKAAFSKIFLKFVARIILLLVALYVILSRSLLPSTPLLAGLFASVAAVMLQTVYALVGGSVEKSG